MSHTRRIAVIGAGASGLTAIKSCKEEGIAVVCFEQTESFGGRWRYRKIYLPGVASVMKSTVSIHSKEMNAFSDFPPPMSFPNYLHHSKMLEYLRLYAETFDLFRHIKYQQEVKRIVPATDFNETGKWIVTSVNGANYSETTEEFDGVMICTGRLSHPFIPTLPNREFFKSRMIHSQELKVGTGFENLNVVIVGNGNSAMDAAVDISVLAKQHMVYTTVVPKYLKLDTCIKRYNPATHILREYGYIFRALADTIIQNVYLSTRSGSWILPKVGPKGLPFDMTLLRRHVSALKKYFGSTLNHFLEKYLERKFQHEVYQLKPDHRVLDNRPAINDIIPDKILTGRVCIKGPIAEFKENSVLFEGDECPTKADVTLLATGYELKVPVLDDNIYKTIDGRLNLYKGVFPIGLFHPTLAIIGFVDTQGPSVPLAENQSRWVARVFTKKLNPSLLVVDSNVETKTAMESPTLVEDYMEYMDALALEYSAKPDLSTLLFKDPYLYWKCLTGPCLSYQYRINGPHAWEGARRAILDAYERVVAPLSNNFSANQFMNNNNITENKECYDKLEPIVI